MLELIMVRITAGGGDKDLVCLLLSSGLHSGTRRCMRVLVTRVRMDPGPEVLTLSPRMDEDVREWCFAILP